MYNNILVNLVGEDGTQIQNCVVLIRRTYGANFRYYLYVGNKVVLAYTPGDIILTAMADYQSNKHTKTCARVFIRQYVHSGYMVVYDY